MRFFSILKPGIIFGNIITVCGGFFLGSQTQYQSQTNIHAQVLNPINQFNYFHWLPIFTAISLYQLFILLMTLLGMALIVGSGCVFNNMIDRDIDKLMARTCDRVLVKGLISLKTAFIYGAVLGLVGFLILYFYTNFLTLIISMIGWFFYVCIYSLFLKRRSTWGTTLGGISGAVPPLVGYAAITNRFDLGAVILFLILFLWQMPHFYAIAIYRLKDFKAAGIPTLPIKKGFFHTQIIMVLYVIAYLLITLIPVYLGYLGLAYFILALGSGLVWLRVGLLGLIRKIRANNLLEITGQDIAWARKMFFISIINITLLCIFMAVRI